MIILSGFFVQGNKFVVAVKDYLTRESTLLSFKRGDIVKLMDPEMFLEKGWMYGSLNGIVGLFPEEYVRPLARHEVETSSAKVSRELGVKSVSCKNVF